MDVRVIMNPDGVRAALTDSGVLADLKRRGRAADTAAGPGHVLDYQTGPNRARVSVRTGSPQSKRAEATRKTLTRSLDAARS